MQWEEDFYLNRRLGLEQAKYGTYLCQCFILSSGKLTLKEKDWENEIHSSQSFFYIGYYLII